MNNTRKPVYIIATILLILIVVFLATASIVAGQEGGYRIFLPIIYGDETTQEQTLTPTTTQTPTETPTPTVIPTQPH